MRRYLPWVGIALFFCAHATPSGAAPTIFALDGVPGSLGVSARSMTQDAMTIVGGNSFGGQATVWQRNGNAYTPQLLPKTAGADDAFANSINAAGVIAGYQTDVDGIPTATIWQQMGAPSYVATPLPMPAGANGASAFAINTAGQIAGFGMTATSTFPVVWQPTPSGYQANALPSPLGTLVLAATAINDTGLVAGYGSSGGYVIPIVWENGAAHAAFVVKSAAAAAINNHGIGAGVDDSGIDSSPLVLAPFEGDYYGGTLPNSGLGGNGASNHVNDADVLVGYTVDLATNIVSGKEAALWKPTDTYWDYLNLDAWFRQNFIPFDQRWTLREANFISESNWVLGDGTYDFDGPVSGTPVERSFLIDVSTAVPEPGGVALLPFGGLLVSRRRR